MYKGIYLCYRTVMALQFIDKIRKPRYDTIAELLVAVNKELKDSQQIKHQHLQHAIKCKTARKIDFAVLNAIRRACGVTWAKMGEMIDEEFGKS